MGMHFGLLAVKAPLAELQAAFSNIWPNLEVVASEGGFGDSDSIWRWREQQRKFVSANDWSKENPGSEVYFFCQDGPWAVLCDPTYVLPADTDACAKLSEVFGTTVSFVVETTGGCAMFWRYDSGELRRHIESVDGQVSHTGDKMPEESTLGGHYYMEETERLMAAFGLSSPEVLPSPRTTQAVEVIDRTDYGHIVQSKGVGEISGTSTTKKPWWKIW